MTAWEMVAVAAAGCFAGGINAVVLVAVQPAVLRALARRRPAGESGAAGEIGVWRRGALLAGACC